MKLPYIDLWIDLWIFQIQTQLLYYQIEDRTTRWVTIRFTLFNKRGFGFRLYSPDWN